MLQDNYLIKQKIRQFVLQETFAEENIIQNDSLIFKEGYFDSMGFVRLISFIEEEFDIKTVDTDLIEENFKSINSIAAFIVRNTKNI
jgi:acyl carrier protein